MKSNKDVLILGGGIIGMTLAYELAQRGAKVTVLEKGDVGYGCSYGNAGWVTPCFAMPLPMPGMLLKSIGWLMDPSSPLYIQPRLAPSLFRWLFRFLRSMNRPLMLQSIKALVELSKESLSSYAKLNEQFPNAFHFTQKGLLMISQTSSGLAAAEEERRLMSLHQIQGQSLTEDAVRTLEPALRGPLKGGVYFPGEAHLEPLLAVKTLAQANQERGVQLLTSTEVYDFKTTQNRILEVHTTRGIFSADQVVLATGSWSPQLVRSLQLKIPVLGGKGYALILNMLTQQPQIPLMLIERKLAITPRQNSIRLAGTLELVDPLDHSISPRRVQSILMGARRVLEIPEAPPILEIWRGLRPCTPDGVPVIGPSPRFENLFISTGHQMLGLQSAPGSAKLAASLLLNETPAFDPFPFRAHRF